MRRFTTGEIHDFLVGLIDTVKYRLPQRIGAGGRDFGERFDHRLGGQISPGLSTETVRHHQYPGPIVNRDNRDGVLVLLLVRRTVGEAGDVPMKKTTGLGFFVVDVGIDPWVIDDSVRSTVSAAHQLRSSRC